MASEKNVYTRKKEHGQRGDGRAELRGEKIEKRERSGECWGERKRRPVFRIYPDTSFTPRTRKFQHGE